MTAAQRTAPILAVAAWFVVVVTGLALAALKATEPPAWDSLSYLQKALTFWQAVDAGKPFNPFDLPMTVRPPGTILLSYPFGWSDDFRWFYFRSSAIPVTLLIAAVFIGCWSRDVRERWLLAALAAALAGMPLLYQFQYISTTLPSTWGLVDGFMTGVAAISAAAVTRSAATRSRGWAITAAAAAALCLLIKPAGLLVMAFTGIAWLLVAGIGWTVARLEQDAAEQRFVVFSISAAMLIFAAVAAVSLRSAYFSAENVAFGQRVFAVFEIQPDKGVDVASLVRDSFGYVMPVLIVAGLFIAFRDRATRGPALAAALCLFGGGWFWLFKTELLQIRYVMPFAAMAFVLLIPALTAWARNLTPPIAYTGAALVSAPALMIGVLLHLPAPSPAWQRALGVNLEANAFAAENAQGAEFLRGLEAEGIPQASLYVTDTSPALRNVLAVASYPTITDPTRPQVAIRSPVDWQTPDALRRDDMLQSDFIAFEPIKDAARRETILTREAVPDFATETLLINAWLTDVPKADGIVPVSETRVRIVRVADRKKLEAAFQRFEASHSWPPSYHAANPQQWWSAADVAARRDRSSPLTDIAFMPPGETTPALWLRDVETEAVNGSLRVNFWMEAAPETLGNGWRLFGHLTNAAGDILANAETPLVPDTGPSHEKPVRYYTMTYALIPQGAATLAFGILRPNGQSLDFLTARQGPSDWEGRRLILPLAASR